MGPIATRRILRSARYRLVVVAGLCLVILATVGHHIHMGTEEHDHGGQGIATAESCLGILAAVGTAAAILSTAAHALAWPRFSLAGCPDTGLTTLAATPAASARAGPCVHAALCVWRR